MDSAELGVIWENVYRKLLLKFGEIACKTWLSSIVVDKIEDEKLFLIVPNQFNRDWIDRNYYYNILAICKDEHEAIKALDFTVSKTQNAIEISETVVLKKQEVAPPKNLVQYAEHPNDQLSLSLPLDPKLTFENFIVGKPNEFAYNAALGIAESDNIKFNPLFLYGAVGLGKTHLMNAIAWELKKRCPSRNIAYMSAEKFMYHFIKSVRYRDTMVFKEQFRSVDILMIDDIQFMCGKDSTQEEFFHTFNALVDNNRQVVVSADKSPSDLEGLEERLRSRLGWGLVADIHPTNYELRLGILQAKAAFSPIDVQNKVMEFIAHRVTSNIRELEGALNRVVAGAMFLNREITIDSAKDILADLLRTSDRKVTIEDIQKKVAAHYSIKLNEMSSARRVRQIALPRQVAMYLSKILTTQSLPEIGRNFGGRDHTTVIHAYKKIKENIEKDPNLAEDIRLLTQILTK